MSRVLQRQSLLDMAIQEGGTLQILMELAQANNLSIREIIARNDIKSVTVVRMEVPCCGGIENAVKKALIDSGKFIPWRVVTVTTDGRLIE